MVTMNSRYLMLVLCLVLATFAACQDDLELHVEVLEATVVQINDDVNNVETNLGSVENDVTQNTGQVFEVMNDVDDIDDLTITQEVRIGALEEEIGDLEEENSLLRTRLEALELMFSSLSGEVQALNETVSDLDVDVTTLESDVTTLEGGFTQLESDVTTLEGDLTALDFSTDQRLDQLEENNGAVYSDTAFLATFSSESFTPGDPIVWDTAILNPGGHYNPESGIYTVPVDGIYQFVLHYQNFADPDSFAYLKVDNVEVAHLRNVDDSVGAPVAEMTLLLTLTSGQEVWISPGDMDDIWGTASSGALYSWFSGHLIYPL